MDKPKQYDVIFDYEYLRVLEEETVYLEAIRSLQGNILQSVLLPRRVIKTKTKGKDVNGRLN